MSYDFYAEKYGRPNVREWNQYTILKCTKSGDEEKYKRSVREFYKNKQIDRYWGYTKWFIPDKKDIPANSVLIKIEFRLKKAFISGDDEQFWPKENTLCKDKFLKIPYVRPSSWKGSLRYVVQDLIKKQTENHVERLFGNKKAGEKAKRGRLTFYPTFLNNIDLDVIAPHDRKTKAGKTGISPIYYEVAPKGTPGIFALLYHPFDLIGHEEKLKEEVLQDLEILIETIPAMLTKYGFGAKTTVGYGVTEVKKIEVNGMDCGNDWNTVLEVVKHEYEK